MNQEGQEIFDLTKEEVAILQTLLGSSMREALKIA